ncbi:hypothetical protein PMIT1342_00034 [Prochlorococcus marinus str. MIT 1342]|nr:hypothetical protein PMIT1342_00034 [Prochlorococcus marinus str. MIT 1342]
MVCADFDPEGDDWPRAALEQIRGNVSALHMVDSQRVLVTREDLDDIGPAMQYVPLCNILYFEFLPDGPLK